MNMKFKLSVCLSPIYDLSEESQLDVFMNYYALQGVEMFTFYKRHWDEKVEKYLQKYWRYIFFMDVLYYMQEI